jgi:glyoxylase-like metal-dependent hydrolase (beta-lactamase superfamily II)
MLLPQAGPVVFAADLIPGLPWLNQAITMGYDRFPEQVIDEKSLLLRRVAAEGLWLAYTHDPDVALSQVRLDGDGRASAAQPQGEVRQWSP